MKAAVIDKHGSADELQIRQVDIPTINQTDVLIQVKAFALNRLDIWGREGSPALKIEFPHVGISDFSGIIHEIGKNVQDYEIGDRVVVNAGISCRKCEFCRRGEQSLCPSFHLLGEHVWGGAAEFAKVPATNILKIPDHLSFAEAAAACLTSLTVYRMTSTKARIKPGEKVLVVGSGGGIGSIALQMAKHLGAFVIALTSTPQKIQMAKDLGADIVINYKERPDWSKEIWKITEKKGVDVVLDSTGQTVFKDCIRSLNKGGRYVTCGATSGFMGEVNLGLIFWKQLEILGSTMASDQEFKEALNLVFQGKIKPIISKTYPFEQIKQAHLYQEDSQHIGKVVVTVP